MALSMLFTAFAAAQEAPFKSGISIVEIDVAVAGKAGPIEGLQLSDFAVQDNRQPVTLRDGSQDESALDVVLVFELTKLMASKLDQIRIAAEMAMAELREGDRVAVMGFNENVWVEQPLTGDLKAVKLRIRNGLFGAAFRGVPYVLPAANAAAQFLAKLPEPHGRRVVLMFTGDAGYGIKNENHMGVSKELWDADASLSAMVIPNALTRVTRDTNPAHYTFLAGLLNLYDFIDDVAEQTGGEVVYSASVGAIRVQDNPYAVDPNTSLRRVVRQMRRRYRLYYDMPAGKPGQRREIHIELSPDAQALHPGARIIGRKGYVIPKPGSR
jgi:hypothetical protein